MSFGGVPRIPERPRRVRKPVDAVEGSPSPSPLVGDPSSDGSSSPSLPAHRPQRLKSSVSPPVVPVARPAAARGDSSDLEPPITQTLPDQTTSDDSSVDNDKLKPSQSSLEHEDVPVAPVRRPLRVKTTPVMPAMPATRPPIKARTATSIDEMDVPEEPLNRNVKRSTTENLDLLVQNTSDQLKEMEMLLSKHEASSERGKLSRQVGRQSGGVRVEDLASELPMSDASSHTSELGAASGTEPEELETLASKNVESEADVEQIDQEEQSDDEHARPSAADHIDESLVAASEIKLDTGEEAELPRTESPVVSGNEESVGSDSFENVKGSFSTEGKADPDFCKEEEVSKSTEEDADPALHKEKNTTVSNKDFGSNDSLSKVEEKNEGSTSAAAPAVLKPADAQEQKAGEQSVPSAKRGAPPVPKKPSSRIAAFQQMLQKQQLEQLQAAVPSRSRNSSPSADAGAGKPLTSSGAALSEDRAQFSKNLGALFANPGMIPGGLPTGAPRKDVQNSPSPEDESAKSAEKATSDVRQRRARGPRGRKLPTNVANVEQVKTEHGHNVIELFHVWTIVSTKTDVIDVKEVLEADLEQDSIQLPEEVEARNTTSGGLQERRPSISDGTTQSTEDLQKTFDVGSDKSLNKSLQDLAQSDLQAIVSFVSENPKLCSETPDTLQNEGQDTDEQSQIDRL